MKFKYGDQIVVIGHQFYAGTKGTVIFHYTNDLTYEVILEYNQVRSFHSNFLKKVSFNKKRRTK